MFLSLVSSLKILESFKLICIFQANDECIENSLNTSQFYNTCGNKLIHIAKFI